MKSLKSQAGFSVEHVLLVLVVLGIIGFTGYKVYQMQQSMDKTADTTTNQSADTSANDDVPAIDQARDLDTANTAIDKVDPDESLNDTNSLDSEISDF